MDGIGDRRMAALEAPSDGRVICAWWMKALNALSARVAVPHDLAHLKRVKIRNWRCKISDSRLASVHEKFQQLKIDNPFLWAKVSVSLSMHSRPYKGVQALGQLEKYE
jgi:hypothetical protein